MDDKFIYNNQILKDRRKELRNNRTKAETLLWLKLKNSQVGGFKFVRQYSVGPYILDFYCPKIRFAIELDGNHHRKDDSVLYDKDRTKYLESVDIEIIRFWNNDIINDMQNVLKNLHQELLARTSPLKVRGE